MTLAVASRAGSRKAARWICIHCQSRSWSTSARLYATAQAAASDLQTASHTELQRPRKISDSIKAYTKPEKLASKRKPLLPKHPARTRFAPSPTGYLHIGGLRTALFSYLLAKRTGGQFLLRIEDTDQKRLVPDAETKLFADLRWAGLQWDEGPEVGGPHGPHGPYRQSERNDIYQSHARQLLERGAAYRCFCSPQNASDAAKSAYVTSGCYQNCSSLSTEKSQFRADKGVEPFTIRLHQPADADKRIYPDLVYGKIPRLKRSIAATPEPDLDSSGSNAAADTILMKSDGTPTYHFANVVDDHLMRITHVIRGVEWMASTPLHYDIYAAFGWSPPQFAHVGLLVDENQAKLSKRNKGLNLDIDSMRKQGILPHSLNNFLALLGWSNPTSNDVMDMEMLTETFDLKFTRGNTIVNTQKLMHLQRRHAGARHHYTTMTGDLASIHDLLVLTVDEVRRTYKNPFHNGHNTSAEHRDMLADPLMAYCAEIILSDRRLDWTTPEQWLTKGWVFFCQNEVSGAGIGEMCYDRSGLNGITFDSMDKFVLTFFDSFDWNDNNSDSGLMRDINAQDPSTHQWYIRRLAFCLTGHLRRMIWAAVLSDVPLIAPTKSGLLPSSKILSFQDDILFDFAEVSANHTGAIRGLARQYVERQKLQLSAAAKAKEESRLAMVLEERSEVISSAVFSYFQKRLTYGSPGLNVSPTMAILGEQESKRRMRYEG